MGPCRFDAEQSSQFQAYLGLAQTQEAEEDEDEELRMERGNDLAPNRTCPLSQKEVGALLEVTNQKLSWDLGEVLRSACCNFEFISRLVKHYLTGGHV